MTSAKLKEQLAHFGFDTAENRLQHLGNQTQNPSRQKNNSARVPMIPVAASSVLQRRRRGRWSSGVRTHGLRKAERFQGTALQAFQNLVGIGKRLSMDVSSKTEPLFEETWSRK